MPAISNTLCATDKTHLQPRSQFLLSVKPRTIRQQVFKRTSTADGGLSLQLKRFQRGCKLFDRHQNCVVEISPSFQITAEYIRVCVSAD